MPGRRARRLQDAAPVSARPIVRIPEHGRFPERPPSEQFHFAPERPATEAEFMAAYAKVRDRRRPDARPGGPHLRLRDRRQRQLRLTGRPDACRAGKPRGRSRPRSATTSSSTPTPSACWPRTATPTCRRWRDTLSQSAGSRRPGDGAQDRSAATHDRVLPHRALRLGRARQACQVHRGGVGVHAVLLDRDIGPLLQTQKLLDSVVFARAQGHARRLPRPSSR